MTHLHLYNTNASLDSEFFDEEDIFQCGRCKKQFRSLDNFIHHKREECLRVLDFPDHHDGSSNNSSQKSILDIPSTFISQQIQAEIDNPTVEDDLDDRDGALLSAGDSIMGSNPDNNTALINVMSNSSILHLTPSMVLSDDSVAFSIPVDHNGCLTHIVTHGQHPRISSHGLLFAIPSTDKNNSSLQLLPSSSLEFASSPDNCSNNSEFVNASVQDMDNELDPLPPTMATQDFVDELENRCLEPEVSNGFISSSSISPEPEDDLSFADVVVDQEEISDISAAMNCQNSDDEKCSVANSDRRRLVSESGISSKKCEYCGKMFKKIFNLHQHIRSHTGEKPFHCLVCGRGFTQKSNVKKHMQTHKVWPKLKVTLPKEQISVKIKSLDVVNNSKEGQNSNGKVEYVVNNVYVCQYCNESFVNHHKLKTHMTMHKSEKLFKCIHKDCTATFVDVEGLISHVKNHKDEIEYRCQQCPKIFKNLHDLGTHQFSHLYPNKMATEGSNRCFRCSKCNSKYSTSEALNHHLLTSSHSYPCSHCQLVFVCERYLRRHLKVHGTGDPFQCGQCGKLFKTENYLKSHLVIHSDSKPFSCETCGTQFNRRDKLTRHRRIHESRKKYKCPFTVSTGCDREFYRKDKLKDHLLSHSRKSYLCPKCGKSFSWPTRLRHHLVEFHPEMLSSTTCTECQKIFKTKHHLKIHLCKGPHKEGTKYKPQAKRKSRSARMAAESNSSSNTSTSFKDQQINLNDLEEDGVMYRDCEIMVKCDSGDKDESVILGSLTLTSVSNDERSASNTEGHYSDSNDNVDISTAVLGPIAIGVETNVDASSIDPLMAGD